MQRWRILLGDDDEQRATMMVEQSDERDALRARLAGMWGAVAGGWARARRLRRRARGAERGADARRWPRWARRPCPRARLRTGRARARGRRARRARRRGRPHRRRRGDDRDRRRARRRAGPGQRRLPPPRARGIDEPDASYDVVLCREGLMFALEPARAVAEIRRVLRPGGASRSPCGPRASATRGSASSWTSSASRPGRRCRRRDPGPVRPRRSGRVAPPPRQARA